MMKNCKIEADWKLVGSSQSTVEDYLELSKFEKTMVSILCVKTHHHLAPTVVQ
jgi:hypothetical protein